MLTQLRAGRGWAGEMGGGVFFKESGNMVAVQSACIRRSTCNSQNAGRKLDLLSRQHPIREDLRERINTLHRISADRSRKDATVDYIQSFGSPHAKLPRYHAVMRAGSHLVRSLEMR